MSSTTKRKIPPSTLDRPPAKKAAAAKQQQQIDAFFTRRAATDAPPSAARDNDDNNDAADADDDDDDNDKTPPGLLSDEQRRVLDMVVAEGKSLFFTGSAGTGKSHLLRCIVAALRKKHARHPERLAVCASTGVAAQNIAGSTIHAWGAVTPGMHDVGKLVSFIKTCRPAHRRWRAVRVLIIDEVSMVDGRLFDTLDALARTLRKNDSPFGGIQTVVTGDFFQLPPVTHSGQPIFFAFQSAAWQSTIQHRVVALSRVFRQKDSEFITLLNALRKGITTTTTTTLLLSRLSRPLASPPTELFPLRADVDRANAARMAALPPGPTHTYTARDHSSPSSRPRHHHHHLLDAATPAPATLALKLGARVMLVRTIKRPPLVNGSVGSVVAFHPSPRRKNSSGRDHQQQELLPLVEFGATADDDDDATTTKTVLVERDEFRAEDAEGKLLARRVQIPLVLAWAMSIHKAQGQTIQRVKVDLNKVFEKGQSYVALSRAASLDGLQVIGFDPKKVVAHPQVVEWSNSLEHEADGAGNRHL